MDFDTNEGSVRTVFVFVVYEIHPRERSNLDLQKVQIELSSHIFIFHFIF